MDSALAAWLLVAIVAVGMTALFIIDRKADDPSDE